MVSKDACRPSVLPVVVGLTGYRQRSSNSSVFCRVHRSFLSPPTNKNQPQIPGAASSSSDTPSRTSRQVLPTGKSTLSRGVYVVIKDGSGQPTHGISSSHTPPHKQTPIFVLQSKFDKWQREALYCGQPDDVNGNKWVV